MATHSSILAWKIQWTEEPCAVHRVTKSCTWVSDFTFTFHFHALEKEMATHSSVLAWRIPGMREPGGLLSMGSHRVGHDWSDLAAAAECVLGTFLGTVHTLILRMVSELWALQLPAWRLGDYPQAKLEAKWRNQVCLRALWLQSFWLLWFLF